MRPPIQFSRETLPLHRTASGAVYEIDVWTYTHPEATQKVYLQGGLHGIELTGIPVLFEFMREIEERQPPLHCGCGRRPDHYHSVHCQRQAKEGEADGERLQRWRPLIVIYYSCEFSISHTVFLAMLL